MAERLKMQRRSFLKGGGALMLPAAVGAKPLPARISTHHFDKHDFGSEPPVTDRLYQAPLVGLCSEDETLAPITE